MASSYSTDLKLELMVTGENAGTWGDNTNNNLNLIQQAIAGYEAVALTDGGTVALAMTDKTISNARNMVIKFTGTLTSASTVTIPDSIEKFYIFDLSAVTGVTNLTIKTVSGTGFTAGEAAIVAAYSDGTNLNEIALDTLGGTIGTAQIDDNSITTAKISDNQITTAKISDNQVTTAKISDNQITTAKISDNQITTAKISDNQVTAAKLDDVLTDSGGTAGTYNSATITVDAQGRLTAASSGAGGAGQGVMLLNASGPASGTVTSAANAGHLAVYMAAGGGGGGLSGFQVPTAGGTGGAGFYSYSIPSAPFSAPYSVGAGGNNRTNPPGPGSGNAGGSTSLTNVGTVNGGNAGGENNTGNPGTAPGATLSLTPTNVGGGLAQIQSHGAQATPGILVVYENTGI